MGRTRWGPASKLPREAAGRPPSLTTWGLSTEPLASLRERASVSEHASRSAAAALLYRIPPLFSVVREPGIGRHAGACARGQEYRGLRWRLPTRRPWTRALGHHLARPVRPQFPEPSAGTLCSGAAGVHGEGGSMAGATSLGSPRHWPGLPTATAAGSPCFEMSRPDLRCRPPHTPMRHLGPLATEHLCGHSSHLPRPAAWPAVAPAVWPSKQEGLLPPAGVQQKCQKTRVSGGVPATKEGLLASDEAGH